MSDYHHSGLKVIQDRLFEEVDASLKKRIRTIADQLREITNLSLVTVEGLKTGQVNCVNAELVLNQLVGSIFESAKHAHRAMEAERFVNQVRHIEANFDRKETKGGGK